MDAGEGLKPPLAEANPASATLDLRLPHLQARTSLMAPVRPRDARTVHLIPRKSFIERGVEGSREALIDCQKGAYPGATIAAYGVQSMGAESQPDHCRRF